MKMNHQVAVVATVSQQMDEDGQLVVRIEPTDSVETLERSPEPETITPDDYPITVETSSYDLTSEIGK